MTNEEIKTPSYMYIIGIVIILITILYFYKYKKNTANVESYKTQQVRDDPYDGYDVQSEIDKLLKKQDKYLENINSSN